MATRLSGKIIDLKVRREGTRLALDNDAAEGPLDNSWLIQMEHENYNSLYSLALAAAANRWSITLWIQGSEDISPTRAANVRDAAVGWAPRSDV